MIDTNISARQNVIDNVNDIGTFQIKLAHKFRKFRGLGSSPRFLLEEAVGLTISYYGFLNKYHFIPIEMQNCCKGLRTKKKKLHFGII